MNQQGGQMTDVKRKDTRKGDRHRPGYWVEYGRKRRAKEREAKAQRVVTYRVKGDEK